MTGIALHRMDGPISRAWPETRHAAVRLVGGAVLVWLAISAVGLLLAHPLTSVGFAHWEGGVDRWFADHRRHGWNVVTNAASIAGDTPAAIGLSVVAFFVLRLLLHRWRESVLLAVTMIGEVAIFTSSAAIVGRKRPGVTHLDGSPPTSSFPSGHTAAATSFYGVLVVVVFCYSTRVAWRSLAVALASVTVLSIGLSRLYRGMHFPTDVAGGIALGLLWVGVTYVIVLRGHTRREKTSGPPAS